MKKIILLVFVLGNIFSCLFAKDQGKSITLNSCSEYMFGEFKISPYLKVATELQKLPKKEQIKHLNRFSQDPKNEMKLHVLCIMLFCEKDGTSVIDPHILGGSATVSRFPDKPQLYGPVIIYKNCPILISSGYRLAGMPVPSAVTLKRCIDKKLWRNKQYEILTKKEQQVLIKDFMDSKEWSDLFLVYDSPTFFTKQAESGRR